MVVHVRFGVNSPDTIPVTLGVVTLCWSVQDKYLGCHFICKECEVDPSSFVGRFYGMFNNILNVTINIWHEIMALHLIQNYCLPSLTYGSEIWNLTAYNVCLYVSHLL